MSKNGERMRPEEEWGGPELRDLNQYRKERVDWRERNW